MHYRLLFNFFEPIFQNKSDEGTGYGDELVQSSTRVSAPLSQCRYGPGAPR